MVLLYFKMSLRCCIPRCQNKGRFGFHKFPRDEQHCLKWQSIAKKRNIGTRYIPYSSYRVCENHFSDNDYNSRFGRKQLIKTAIPSICVPKIESIYEEHSYVHSSDEDRVNDGVSNYMFRKINVCIVSVFNVLFCYRPMFSLFNENKKQILPRFENHQISSIKFSD